MMTVRQKLVFAGTIILIIGALFLMAFAPLLLKRPNYLGYSRSVRGGEPGWRCHYYGEGGKVCVRETPRRPPPAQEPPKLKQGPG